MNTNFTKDDAVAVNKWQGNNDTENGVGDIMIIVERLANKA
jgi:hypothetical protein